MSVPDPRNIERAAELCTCPGGNSYCDRACTVCFSPTWEGFACVKQLCATMIGAANVPVSLPPNIGTQRNPQLPIDPNKVEECIDWLEAQGITLLPWQAELFRQFIARPQP